jgi:opacity protein-like surface antigen
MRKYLLAAVATVAIASPAAAQQAQGPYAGVSVGGMIVEDIDLDGTFATGTTSSLVTLDHEYGIDADVTVGYDFGAIRAEVEGAWKRASLEEGRLNNIQLTDGRTRVYSLMGNLLLDFGGDGGLSGFVGGGAGIARTRLRFDDDTGAADGVPTATTPATYRFRDDGFAWQLLAGIRHPISDNIDLGLKYRFFNSNADRDDFSIQGRAVDVDSRFRSHSLLATLNFNFGAAPPPPPPPPPPPAPPPPPPPPATQTCPDGSVVLATDACPVPPPPPPPPPPAPERG